MKINLFGKQLNQNKLILNENTDLLNILVIDCGIKNSILRQLAKRDLCIKVVPHDYDFVEEEIDGLFLSNGPGNPEKNVKLIENLR